MLPFNSHCSGCHRCPAIEQDVWDEGEGRKGNGAERVDGETAKEGSNVDRAETVARETEMHIG